MAMYRAVVGCVCLSAALAAAALAAEKRGPQSPVAPLDPVGQFEHLGIFTAEKKPGERFVAATKVWVTDFQKHPYRVEWLRSDGPFKGPIVRSVLYQAAEAAGLKRFQTVRCRCRPGGVLSDRRRRVVELMEF